MARATIKNFEAFGKLVKEWAKGTKPLPEDLEQLKGQAEEAGAGLTIPPNYTSLQITRRTADTLHLMVPVPDMVEETEQGLADDNVGYPLPEFYRTLFQSNLPSLTAEQRLKLHAERIGDYTTGQCG